LGVQTFAHGFALKITTNNLEYLKIIVSLQKKSCTQQFESKLSLRSFAFSLHQEN